MPWLKLPRSNRPTKMAHRTSKHMGVQEKERSPIWSYQIWRNQRNISQEKNKAWWYLWCLCGMFVSVCQSSSMISYSRFMYVPCIYTNLPFNHPKMSSIWVFERSSKPSPTHVQNSTPLFPGGVSMADWHHQPWPTRFTTICQWIVKIRDPGNMKRWLFSMGFLLGYTPKDMPEARSLHGSTINVFTMPALPFCLQKESRAKPWHTRMSNTHLTNNPGQKMNANGKAEGTSPSLVRNWNKKNKGTVGDEDSIAKTDRSLSYMSYTLWWNINSHCDVPSHLYVCQLLDELFL